jgi:iron complex outermembrane receptor protein
MSLSGCASSLNSQFPARFTKIESIRTVALAAAVCLTPELACAQSLETLGQMSIEELGNVEITSVSKRPEPLADAPAAIYVLDHDQIVRSGADSVPEMLRLAPNLFVAQTSPSDWVITARGLSGNFGAQNFTNKILVLIDGRSVYTPLYSGVYWDVQDLLPDDIDRIEVISGPGATLWGANAVNGVINITTRSSSATQGGLIELGGGSQGMTGVVRFGGQLADDLSYRVYAKALVQEPFDAPPGGFGGSGGDSARDGWSKQQGGFRLDWRPAADLVTFQGDLYAGAEDEGPGPDQLVSGGNLQASWNHPFGDGSNLHVLTYYDQTRRSTNDTGGFFVLRTYDFEVEHSFTFADWNKIVWGVGDRVHAYRTSGAITPTTTFQFVPAQRTLNLANLFIEDTMTLGHRLEITAGLKLENDPFSGLTPMPDVRISWKPFDSMLLWAAVSRAIRAPAPFDRDVVETANESPFGIGDRRFQPETLNAFELGYRQQITPALSLSVSGFKNVYDNLRSIVGSGPDGLEWGNGMRGNIYGIEAWAAWQVTGWWQLNAGVTVQHESLGFKPETDPTINALFGVAQAGDDPHHWASLRSSMNLGRDVSFDADLRYVGALPNPPVPDYAELNLRLGWRVTDRLEVAVSGQNLLHDKHLEYTSLTSDLIKRSFFIDTRWKF